MSKQELELAACVGKKTFPDKGTALKVAARMRRNRGERLEPYKCKSCGMIHIGKPIAKPGEQKWMPQKHKDRPTPERKEKSTWELHKTEIAGIKVARAIDTTPVDRMEHVGLLSNDQASAGRQFEELYAAARETPGTRDSCTIWEPKGFESDDGNVKAVRDRRELYLFLGVQKDMMLRHACVEHREPRGDMQVGLLREALNECVRFFKT